MLIKLTDGNLKDVRVEEVTPDNYIVPEGEEDVYHIKQEIVQFSPTTGQRLSHPRIQKYDAKMWSQLMQRQLKISGYTISILHDPTSFIKEREAKKAELKASLGKPKRSERDFQKAVEEAVANEIAKLTKRSRGKKDVDTGSNQAK